jgi:hypothetical protein
VCVIDHRDIKGAVHEAVTPRPQQLAQTRHPALGLTLGVGRQVDEGLALFGRENPEGELLRAGLGAADDRVRRYPDAVVLVAARRADVATNAVVQEELEPEARAQLSHRAPVPAPHLPRGQGPLLHALAHAAAPGQLRVHEAAELRVLACHISVPVTKARFG